MSNQVFSFQARLTPDPVRDDALDRYAQLYGHIERRLFAKIRAGQSSASCKNGFLKEFSITARQLNAIRIGLEGKIASIAKRRPELICEAEQRISRLERTISKIEGRLAILRDPVGALKSGKTVKTLTPAQRADAIGKQSHSLHQKRRKLTTSKTRLDAMKTDRDAGKINICFGSRKLFQAQFDLTANGYTSLDEWRNDWKVARSNQFYVLGSQDESTGNQSCQSRLIEDGTLSIKLRLPDAMKEFGKYLDIPSVHFAYGHKQIVAALQSSRLTPAKTKDGKAIVKRVGTALSYRFVRDAKSWRVFVSVEVQPVNVETRAFLGAVGVDTNADHLAVAEVDRFGNVVTTRRIDLPLYGKTTDQAKALIGDACVAVAEWAKAAGKPVVIEELDFSKKKQELQGTDPRYARMLSSFNCHKIASGIDGACFRAGVGVVKINPAYTSVIGAVNYAQVKGISVHMAAALAIARRGLGLSEKPAVRKVYTPVRNGDHVTFVLPVRNRAKHVWSHWSAIRTKLNAAHVAHVRSGAAKSAPAPLRRAIPALGAYWTSTAGFRGANRQENCSPDVLGDVPW